MCVLPKTDAGLSMTAKTTGNMFSFASDTHAEKLHVSHLSHNDCSAQTGYSRAGVSPQPLFHFIGVLPCDVAASPWESSPIPNSISAVGFYLLPRRASLRQEKKSWLL
jgi:hypothetical protein